MSIRRFSCRSRKTTICGKSLNAHFGVTQFFLRHPVQSIIIHSPSIQSFFLRLKEGVLNLIGSRVWTSWSGGAWGGAILHVWTEDSRLEEEGYPYNLRRVVSFCRRGGWHPRMRRGRELLCCFQTLAWIYNSVVDTYLTVSGCLESVNVLEARNPPW